MNVFLISSALQLINAAEARHHYAIPGEKCVLILLPIEFKPGDIERLDHIASSFSWALKRQVSTRGTHIHTANRARAWAILNFRRFVSELNGVATEIGTVDRVFLGHYGDKWRRHLANVLARHSVHVLDDGFATLTSARMRWDAYRKHSYDRRAGKVGAGRAAVEYLLGARFGDPDHVTFFSAYELTLPPGDRLVPHAYTRLRSDFDTKTYSEDGMLLGSPLVENRMVSEAQYEAMVRAIGHQFGGGPLTYYPHRAEQSDRLERLKRRLDLEVVVSDVPFEWVMVTRPSLPAYLAGFHSSALYNCHLLVGDRLEIRAYRPDYDAFGLNPSVTAERYLAMQRVYDYMEAHASEHLRVVPLTPSDLHEHAGV